MFRLERKYNSSFASLSLITVTACIVRIVTIPQQQYNYYCRHRQGSRATSSFSQQQLEYSQQSNKTACFTCSCAFAQRKTKKENEKSGEKTITEDACVCLCDISYSHLIVQHKQKIYLSLLHTIFLSITNYVCSSFPFIKNATNNNGKKFLM